MAASPLALADLCEEPNPIALVFRIGQDRNKSFEGPGPRRRNAAVL